MSNTDQHAGTRAAERSTVVGRDHLVPLLGGRATARYRRCGRWAITSYGVCAHRADQELALSGYLDVLRAGRLRPLFTDVADQVPFGRRGLDTYRYAEEAVLEPARFDLATAGHGDLARDVLVARRRLVVLPCHDEAIAGETWTAVDTHGTVHGTTTWVPSGAVGTHSMVTIMVDPHAPAGTAELLIADAVAEYRDRGVARLELGRRSAPWWPGGRRVATGEPRAVVDRFEPQWQPRWLALYSLWLLPAAVVALCAGSAA
jgi:lysylphosphatidylglycerol synthetase-like protein (DUF2156 family)